jgi:hypothetical protein
MITGGSRWRTRTDGHGAEMIVDERRDTTESTVETVIVQRGTIILEMWPWGEVDWVASNRAGALVAMGTEPTRAYALVAGCVALIREGGYGS